MNILVGCESSGVVREAFRVKRHNAWSCDLILSENKEKGYHLKGDVRWWLNKEQIKLWKWDMLLVFPPCTYLAVSGARWFKYHQYEQKEALKFIKFLLNVPIKRICLENPIGIISTKIRKPDQIIQPWQFGHGETKATCLWLKNLPLLKPTKIVKGRENRIHRMAPSKNRSKLRSITYTGIANAMASQWG